MPIEQPPRIRGKQIVDGEITSQKIATDLQSDNWIQGFSGWFISRATGSVEFNEGVFRGDVAISGNLEVSGENGILTHDGGDLRVESGGDIIIDGGELVAGPVVLNAGGLTVGSDVVIDSTGLHVAGGDVISVEPFRDGTTVNNASLTTTHADVLSVTITPPTWAQTMILNGNLVGYMSNSSGGTQRLATSFRIDTNPEVGTIVHDVPDGMTQGMNNTINTDGSGSVSLPTAFSFRGRAWVTSGTNSANHLKLTVSGLFLR